MPPVIYLSHENVLIGFENKCNMYVFCPTFRIAQWIFPRAVELYKGPDGRVEKNKYHIERGFVGLRFGSMGSDSLVEKIYGYQGLVMFPPECQFDHRHPENLHQINKRNQRYIKPWQP